MIHKKLLVIGSYPIKNPHHGGQKRLEALVRNYETFIEKVKFVAVFHKTAYPDYEDTDICLGQKSVIDEIDKDPYYSELIVGEAPNKDNHTRSYMAKLLLDYKPDIIHIEQPYLYGGMKVLIEELNIRVLLVFGSENIEAPLKKEILDDIGYDQNKKTDLVQRVDVLERALSKDANLVIAVSREDAKAHRSMGSKYCIVAPNGINKSLVSKESKRFWKSYKEKYQFEKMVTIIGSGHPPNYNGFLSLVGVDTRFLSANSKIVIAGGVAEYFKITYKKIKKNKPFWENVEAVGFLSEEKLSGLIDATDVVILPINSGGGSNLKTAEAILSGKKIVATRFAFRGFEDYLFLPNIYLADTKSEFKKEINTALDSPYLNRTKAEVSLAKRVEWGTCLSTIEPALRSAIKRHERLINRLNKIIRRIARVLLSKTHLQ